MLQKTLANVLRLLNHEHLGPKLIGSFGNGFVLGDFPGELLTFKLATDPEISAILAKPLAKFHRLRRFDYQIFFIHP